MTTVNSLNSLFGAVSLGSSNQSVGIAVSGSDINLTVSTQGNQGGVTSLNSCTGAANLTSSGGTVAITYPSGQYPLGNTINLEAVGGGGGGGIASINGSIPPTSDFTLTAGANVIITTLSPGNIEIKSSAASSGIASINTIPPDVVGEFQINGGGTVAVTPHQNGIDITGSGIAQVNGTAVPDINHNFNITAGTNVTVVNDVNGVTISSSGGGGGGIATINTISPDAAGEFTIGGLNGISVITSAVNPNKIDVVNGGVNTINSINSDIFANFNITAGTNVTVTPIVNGVEISSSGGGGGGITSINNSTPAGSDFTLTAGTGIAITTLAAGDIEISQSVAAVTEINGLFPSAGSMTIAVGAGLTITGSGNTITLDSAGASGTPGFEYVATGTLNYSVVQGTSAITAPYSVYVSGTSPHQICTVQIDTSSTSTVSGAFPTITAQMSLIPANFVPKYSQRGCAIGVDSGANNSFACPYTVGVDGSLYLNINNFQSNVSIASSFFIEGMSIMFPIVPQVYQLLLGTDSSQISEIDFPTSQPTSTLSVVLTTPAYASAPTVVNLGSGTANLPSVVYGSTTTSELVVTSPGNNYVINQYTTRTTTQVATVDLRAATGFADLYVLGICCSPTNNSCYALCFSALQNAGAGAHYIIDVFASPLVDLNLNINGYGAGLAPITANSMSCSATILCMGYSPADGTSQAVTTSYAITPNSSISVLTFAPSPNQNINFIYIDASDNCFYKFPFMGSDFFATDPTNFASLYSVTYVSPSGYNVTKCIGKDPYGNLIVSATNNDGVSADKLFAYTISTVSGTTVAAPTYEISGASFNGMLILGAQILT